jgi:hypothetical protein
MLRRTAEIGEIDRMIAREAVASSAPRLAFRRFANFFSTAGFGSGLGTAGAVRDHFSERGVC